MPFRVAVDEIRMRDHAAVRSALLWVTALVFGGCGGLTTGDDIRRTGTVLEDDVCRVLRTSEGDLALLGPRAESLRPGQRVEVSGQFGESSRCGSVIFVKRFRIIR